MADDHRRPVSPARPRLPLSAPRRAAALGVALAVALAGCSLDYGEGLAGDLAEDVPDTVVLGFVHTVVENGVPRFRLEAERGESFQAKRLMRLSGVRFTEYAPSKPSGPSDRPSEQGLPEISAEGRADSAILHTDTESAELSGAVRFYSSGDGVRVESGYLEWDGEARMLRSRSDSVTTLQDDDGSSLSGAGFEADAARRSFSFRSGAQGRYSSPDDGAEEEAER